MAAAVPVAAPAPVVAPVTTTLQTQHVPSARHRRPTDDRGGDVSLRRRKRGDCACAERQREEPPPAPQKCAECEKSLNHQTDPQRFKHKGTQTPQADADPAPQPHCYEQCEKYFSCSSSLLKHRDVHGTGGCTVARSCTSVGSVGWASPEFPLRPAPAHTRWGEAFLLCPLRETLQPQLPPQRHQRAHAQRGPEKCRLCPNCGKAFGLGTALAAHQCLHSAGTCSPVPAATCVVGG
ncbi:zinc finger protein 483-like [Hirundo rustica]|uniref:zinc finger protein 483-like n=1 Tax=Hirundo rustica TaxID=43150 RepID=UPI001A93E0EB|nr:zinc finger protein 483-like [Hirundo rustica]